MKKQFKKMVTRKVSDRGLSDIVATVMLIVIAVVGVSVVASFVIPFVRDPAKKGGDCFQARDLIKFGGAVGSIQTCYNNKNPANTTLIVKRSGESIDVQGFSIALSSDGYSKKYEVLKDVNNNQISDAQNGAIESILEKGTEMAYTINNDFGGTPLPTIVKAEISPILSNGQSCPTSDSIDIPPCN